MSKKAFFVVIVHRDRYYRPKLRITIESSHTSANACWSYISARLLSSWRNATLPGKVRGSSPRMRIHDFRVVDELGLKRLNAAAKASATLRKRRAAKKGWETRRRNAARHTDRSVAAIPYYNPYSH